MNATWRLKEAHCHGVLLKVLEDLLNGPFARPTEER